MPQKLPRDITLISQVFPPDPTAVGQHFLDLTKEMARRGWRVNVITSSRAYNNPSLAFPRRQVANGVIIHRLPLSSFGKSSIIKRLVAQALFSTQALFHYLAWHRKDILITSTSPPFGGFVGAFVSRLTGSKLIWWVMDINPDQVIAARKIKNDSSLARVFEWMNRYTIKHAEQTVVLDKYMAARIAAKVYSEKSPTVLPPWAHTEPRSVGIAGRPIKRLGDGFRGRHNLTQKFIIMYSGNHAIQHPLTTLLNASEMFGHEDNIRFVFIGEGSGKKCVERRIAKGASNIVSLPYQPLEQLEESLSAADLHVVSMGNDVVGIVHPCKIYGAMAVGRPILFFGPRDSHAGELVETNKIGWRVDHGDIKKTVSIIRHAASLDQKALDKLGATAAEVIARDYSPKSLIARMASIIEDVAENNL